MCNAGIPNIIRVGTCGSLDENIKVGDLFVVDEVIRGDGVTPYYVDKDLRLSAIREYLIYYLRSPKIWD